MIEKFTVEKTIRKCRNCLIVFLTSGFFMIKSLSLALLVLSSSAVLADRIDECFRPGQRLTKNLVGIDGDEKIESFSRSGSALLPSAAKFETQLTTNTYYVYNSNYCVIESYTVIDTKCTAIDTKVALGRGNAEFKSLYNLNITIMNRAEIFAKLVKYNLADTSVMRLESAKKIIGLLVQKASQSELPLDWEDFKAHLESFVTANILSPFLVDEIIKTHELANKKALGFVPMTDVTIKENRGNSSFRSLFDLSKPEATRVQTINKLFNGFDYKTNKTNLARFMVEYASINGIPESWDQVVLMFQESVNKTIMSQAVAREIYRVNEEQNRAATGFQVSASKCVNVPRTANVNVVRPRVEREFLKEVSQKIVVNIQNAPLITNEVQRLSVSYSGSAQSTSVSSDSSYNTFQVIKEVSPEAIVFNLTGTRQKVTPPNTLAGNIVNSAGAFDIMLQNTGYNSKIDGTIEIYATFFETRTFLDTNLGSRIIGPKDGSLVKYLAQIKAQRGGRPVYAEVKMRYVGSSFYNSNYSQSITVR